MSPPVTILSFCASFLLAKTAVLVKKSYMNRDVRMFLFELFGNVLFVFVLPISVFALRSSEEAVDLVTGVFFWTSVMFTVGSLYLFVIDPISAFFQARFIGLSDYPIYASQLFGFGLLSTAVRFKLKLSNRFLLAIFVPVFFFGLVLAGSRTGLAATIVALAVLFVHNKKMLLATLGLMLIALPFLPFFLDRIDFLRTLGEYRSFSLEDTRSEAMVNMWNQFLSSPWLGSFADPVNTENSMLLYLIHVGVVGMAFISWFTLYLVNLFYRLFLKGAILGNSQEAWRATLAFAFLAFCFILALLDGYLWRNTTFANCAFLLSVALAAFVVSKRKDSLGTR
ncbi:hypothetical protein GW915_06095 [bacterium]|nr:hypothetical protein [bacterium]